MARILAMLLLALCGMSAVTVPVAIGADTTSPSVPGHLTALGSATQITLLWNPSLDDVGVSGYRVERCQGAGCASFSQLAVTAGPGYVDSVLSTGATYRYRVRAADAAGNVSAYSKVVTAVAGSSGPGLPGGGGSGTDTRPPKPPRGVTATAAGTSITVRWNPATDNVGVTSHVVLDYVLALFSDRGAVRVRVLRRRRCRDRVLHRAGRRLRDARGADPLPRPEARRLERARRRPT